MTGTPTRIGERHVAAVLAMGGGLMLGPVATARADSPDGPGPSADTSGADQPAEPAAAAPHAVADPAVPVPPGGTARGPW